jgi:predicted small lipoprotein YifL
MNYLLVFIATAFLLLTACGQTGPLELPQAQQSELPPEKSKAKK